MFITFEGIEGCGKSTQIKRLTAWLKEQGREVVNTLEPGGSRIGQELRKILLTMESTDLTSQAELFLYLADRAQHMGSLIRPALAEGKVVLSDRFADSTVAYQGYGRGLDPKLLHTLNEVAVDGHWPDLTLVLDLDPEIGLKRALKRNMEEGLTCEEGRFEAEAMSFHKKVREGYLTIAALYQERVKVIDASQDQDGVFTQILAQVNAKIEA